MVRFAVASQCYGLEVLVKDEDPEVRNEAEFLLSLY